MAWMACRSCSTRYAVGLLRCPQCQAVSELFAVPEEVFDAEQEGSVPKITVADGPSNSLGTTEEAAHVTEAPSAEPAQNPAASVLTERPDTVPAADKAVPEQQPDVQAVPKKRAAAKKAATSEADAGK